MTTPSPPPTPVFPAGYGPLPADFNTWVQTSLTFLTNKIVFRASQTVNQNYTNNVNTVVNYDSIREDPYGGWNGTTNAWTAPFDGWYEVTVFNSIQTAGVTLRSGVLVSGGNQQFTMSQHQVSGSFLGGGVSVATVWLVGNIDYVQGQCMVIGANASNDTTAIGRYPRMEITFVSQ